MAARNTTLMSSSEPNFKAFSKIVVFMRELKEAFGADFPEVVKYYKLCKGTSLDKHDLIHRQIQIFGEYCLANREAIQQGSLEQLNTEPIKFNDKIFFNLKDISGKADTASKAVILKYLQIILCLIHPDDGLKQQLIQQAQEERKSSSNTKEEDIFATIFSKVGDRFKDAQPTDLGSTIANLQTSGFMEEITQTISQGFENGELDPRNLMRTAFGLFSKIKDEATDPQMSGMISMVEGLISNAKSQMDFDEPPPAATD